MLKIYHPQIVFFMETKLNVRRMEKVRRRCGYFNGIDVPVEGSRGGLSLGWNGVHLINLKSFSKNHIDVEVQEEEGKPCWRFTGFYGDPEVRNKAVTWDLLRHLGQNNSVPWLVGGDFNDILFAHEKRGGLPREEARMEAFRRVLEDCFLEDIVFTGPWFKWERGRVEERNIQERLDRGVATDSWIQTFPNFSLRHLPHSFSDHCPLLVDTESEQKRNGHNKFRFESWWILEESCEEEIKKLWEGSAGSYQNRMTNLAKGLKMWGTTMQAKRKGEVKRLNRRLEELNDEEGTDENLMEIMEVKLHLNMEIDKEERYWEQRARSNWQQVGDKNTSFFHKYASQRKRINLIKGLQRADGSLATNEREIEEVARRYFSDLFESRGVGDVTRILSGIKSCISDSMNQSLIAPYTEDEIVEALKGMGPTKASGFDGFPVIFYQKFWHIVGKDTCDFCMEVLNCGRSLKEINKTVLEDSLLIMCCWLMRYFRSGRKGYMALKLDMSKAYDRVEWPFIKAVMLKMGFAESFLELIIRCLNSVQFSILINGEEVLNFGSTRGLRQGDPLSPYLFLFCAEGLSVLMRLACKEKKISGAKVCRNSPSITYLMFADDCILFGDVSNRGVNMIKDILKEYEECSGQCINFEKSTMFFSANVYEQDRNFVFQNLGVRCFNDPEKYLGLPNIVGRKKKLAFQVLKDRLKQRINSWSIRHISQGGRETLCTELENVMNAFWWNKNNGKRGMHWCDWESLCALKEEWGMGFRDLNCFNITLLAKQGWRLLRNPNSLLARTLKARYFKDSDFLKSNLGRLPSLTWKSVWATKGLLLKGLGWRIGDGQQVSIWNDSWIPGNNVLNGQYQEVNSNLEKVADLIDSNTRKWKTDLILNTFEEREAERILCIPLPLSPFEDFVVWTGEPTGDYSVRSGHKTLTHEGQTQAHDRFNQLYKRL
ncbi:reverse transcriptase [Gossypium australe]|uniref:Reverse transcriptase n=1 Tax=Gossypium australe TaxID=47621 RepID=A0A5B6USH4_9ROSI|nr:reverse transcriptase [Gossypium australe]